MGAPDASPGVTSGGVARLALIYSTFVLEHLLSPTHGSINGYVSELRRHPWAVLGWTCLALFGLCAIGDAVFPLDCAPSLQTRCALLERANLLSFAHSFHAVTSSMVIVFAVGTLLALSIAARRYGWWPALARWGWPLAVAETVLAFGTLAAMVLGRWLGIVQRLQISVLVLGLLTIAYALYADRRRARAPRPPVPESVPS